MASTGNVIAQIRAASGKAGQSRIALEQAEDLVEEAHDTMARALEGANHLEPDVVKVLATFTVVRDGLKGYLWPLITEVLKAAEGIAARLEGEGATSPVPSARHSEPPPQRSSAPPLASADPSPIPAERIERLRRELPPPVVRNSGARTHGWWVGPDGAAEPITSGYDARSGLVQGQLARMGLAQGTYRSGDVEMKLAAQMAENGIRHATVVINNTVCKGRFNCDTLLPILLPEGCTLTVYGITSNGTRTRTRYTGGARPWWS